jgi:hypothetical protein
LADLEEIKILPLPRLEVRPLGRAARIPAHHKLMICGVDQIKNYEKAGFGSRMEQKRHAYEVSIGKPGEKDHLEELYVEVNVNVILKCILKKEDRIMYTGFI